MKRTLVWHIDRPWGDDRSQGPAYYADHDYLPDAVRLYAYQAPNQDELTVDIRVDGVSIFTSNYAVLNRGANLEEHAEDYPDSEATQISEGSVITLHVVKTGGAENFTCSLEMDTLDDDDELESTSE